MTILSPPKALIFDFGNVITDSKPTLEWLENYEVQVGLERGLLHQRLWSGEVWEAASTGRLSQTDYWQVVSAGLDLPAEMQRFGERAFFGEPINPQIVDLITELRRSQRVRLALCSNALPSLADLLDEEAAIRLNFDLVVVSALVGLRKPDPAIFTLCARWLGLPPSDCCLIDDKERNILAAAMVGMRGIVHTDAPSTAMQLRAWKLIENDER